MPQPCRDRKLDNQVGVPVSLLLVDGCNDLGDTLVVATSLVDLVTGNIVIKASIHQVNDDLPNLVSPTVLALHPASLWSCE